ncbi:unnamed protein product [Rotaria sp. Silwood2]|nr:unnamed protein product [Rotaria sp. Silwood2]
MSVLQAAIELSFWGPIILFTIGVPSAILNAIIFIGVKKFRQSPSSYYIVAQSLFDFGALLLVLLQNSPSTSINASSISCKLIIFFSRIACTSRSARIRKLSSIRTAYCIVLITVLFWSLLSIPFLSFFDLIPPTYTCGFTNDLFQKITNFFLAPILCAIFPLIVLIVFGILTYRNLHLMTTINGQQQSVTTRLSMWEQQITRMMIIQTVLNVSCALPQCILLIYTIATVQQSAMKSLDQIYIEYLLAQLCEFIVCLDFASSFYIFFLSSSRFRQTTKMYLKRLLHLESNQVTPFNISASTVPVTGTKTHYRQN